MNTEEVEKVLGRKFIQGPSLQEQCTPDEWAQICFISEQEIAIIIEKGKADRKSDSDIKKKVKADFDKILKENSGDYKKALGFIPG